jgi:hypothetical protein
MAKPVMNLLGVDVGFAAKAKTTGLAWRINGEVGYVRTGTAWMARKRSLPHDVVFSLAALDAPILPAQEGQPHRSCESVFYGGAFWNRCRPGLSHYGRSSLLREAGADAASQFANVISGLKLKPDIAVRRECAIVEAFPNAFLGVLLPAGVYQHKVGDRREAKSDWLYRAVAEEDLLLKLLLELDWADGKTADLFVKQAGKDGHHDVRAALVCLLTAGFAASNKATVVGDKACGWFWLPPLGFWNEWAREALESQIRKLRAGKFPTITQWTTSVLLQAPVTRN